MERKIIKRGETFIVKEFLKEQKLKDYDIVFYIDNSNKKISQIKNQIESLNNQLETNKEALKQHEKIINDLKSFETETRTRLTKKLKQLVEKHKQESIDKVKSKLIKDVGVNEEQYKLELFNAYRRELHTNEEISREIPDSIIRANFYGNKTLISPKDV